MAPRDLIEQPSMITIQEVIQEKDYDEEDNAIGK